MLHLHLQNIDFTMTTSLIIACARSTWEQLSTVWLVIYFQGHYSVARLKQLNDYTGTLKRGRLLMILVLTPLPSLVLTY